MALKLCDCASICDTAIKKLIMFRRGMDFNTQITVKLMM